MTEHPDVPRETIAGLRSVCLGLPEAYEEPAWVGTRWRIRKHTFAHVHEFEPGIRLLTGSTISFPDAGFKIRCTPLPANFLAVGTGYGLEADWRHGMYQGTDLVVQGVVYEVPAIRQLGAYAVVDHAARFEYDGHVGYGLYEHSFSGAMPKYGLE